LAALVLAFQPIEVQVQAQVKERHSRLADLKQRSNQRWHVDFQVSEALLDVSSSPPMIHFLSMECLQVKSLQS
jgi:Uri superfamily endonuclease